MPTRAHCMAVARDPSTGAALLSATVNVYNPGTVTPISASIFDKNGNVLSNPLTSDAATGLIDFYLNVSQEVDLVVAKTGYTTRTYSNVPVLDDASYELTALLTTTGDIAYASSANTPARLPIGTAGTFLTSGGGSTPAWSNTITAGGLQVTAGNVGIGSPPSSRFGLVVTSTVSGANSPFGIYVNPTGDSSSTLSIDGVYSIPATAAATFTSSAVSAFHAASPTKGAGSTITSAYGLLVDSITPGGTNNYGVYINAPSGASGVNAALYVAGGDAVLGLVGVATNATSGFALLPSCAGAPTGVPLLASTGRPVIIDSTNNKLWAYVNGAWKGVVLT